MLESRDDELIGRILNDLKSDSIGSNKKTEESNEESNSPSPKMCLDENNDMKFKFDIN